MFLGSWRRVSQWKERKEEENWLKKGRGAPNVTHAAIMDPMEYCVFESAVAVAR